MLGTLITIIVCSKTPSLSSSMHPLQPQTLLWIVALTPITITHAALIASSQLQLCTNNGASTTACKPSFIMSISVDGSSGGGEAVQYEWASATDSNGAAVTITDDVTIVVTKSQPRIRYPVYYSRNYNAQPTETVVYTGLFGCEADSSSSSPTCGRAFTSTGAPVAYSEGYCCSCSFCDLISLCNSNSRANTDCSLLGDAQSASCLRMGSRWYGGYTIGPGQRQYTITVNITSSRWGTTTLVVGPDVVGAAAANVGVAVRLVGDFAAFIEPWDLTSRMLFVPVGLPSDVRVAAGPAEWLLVPATMVSVDGTACNMVGVSYEGFYSQANRCVMAAGSCTRNQLEDLRSADVAAVASGKAPTYFMSAYGSFVYEANERTRVVLGIDDDDTIDGSDMHDGNATRMLHPLATSPYISYVVPSVSASLLTLTFEAANVSYVTNVANGTILWANLSTTTLTSSTRDGILTVVVYNSGTITSEYTLQVTGCSSGTFPMTAAIASIAPKANFTTTFNVVVQAAVTVESQCTVVLYNSLQQSIDSTVVRWVTLGLNVTNGAQDGSGGGAGGGVNVGSGWDSVDCPTCPWYSPLCFVQQQCFWALVFQVAAMLVVLGVIVVLIRWRKCFMRVLCPHTDSSSEDGSEDEARKRKRHRAERRRRRHRSLHYRNEEPYTYYDDGHHLRREPPCFV